jgi:hypothetical protein
MMLSVVSLVLLLSGGALAQDSVAPYPISNATNTTNCKVVRGDPGWPSDTVWETELPGIQKSPPAQGNTTRPDFLYLARKVEDVQAAVQFATKHNVRLTIINSGHDFLGR